MVNGTDSTLQGRVEVFYNGTWGTVCDNGWDLTDANVVCRELGLGLAVKALTSSAFGMGKGKIWMDDVQCIGSERLLAECTHRGWEKSYCDHSKDVGVVCNSGNEIIFILNKNGKEVLANITFVRKWLDVEREAIFTMDYAGIPFKG